MSAAEQFSTGSSSGLSAFFTWWLDELSSLAPKRARRTAKITRVIDVVDGEAIVKRVDGRREREVKRVVLGDVTPDHAGLAHIPKRGPALRLAANQVLSLRMRLPRAAEGKLDQILLHEFGARIPFEVDDAYFDFRVVSRARGLIEVEMFCAHRRMVDALRAQLAAQRLVPAVVLVDRADVDLLRRSREATRPGMKSLNTLLALALVGLLGTAIWLPLQQRMQAVAMLENELETAHRAANATLALEEQVQTLKERREALAGQLATSTPRVQLLDDLSRALPDTVWLRRLAIDGNVIHLSGDAGKAAPLISVLGGLQRFSDPSFESPITGADDTERFELQAWIAGETPR